MGGNDMTVIEQLKTIFSLTFHHVKEDTPIRFASRQSAVLAAAILELEERVKS